MAERSLKGRTLFITGGTRGIGHAIGLRAARDGANIVIAAKTTEPHPKLAGTIFTAADDMRAAGGQALAVACDIRFEDQVEAAVAQTVSTFGGIDVLVNNASAIFLAGTLETPMKRYDLMHQINARGTYLCSQKCLPHLKTGTNPQILNISPPLSLKPRWFANNVAYTMAKYGMSMCVLGMAAEFSEEGIGVNALWPRTSIWTAAVENLLGAHLRDSSRKPEIMADAAWWILTSDSRKTTGNFFIDDDVLQSHGVTDLEPYAVCPGHPLQEDFFLD